MRCTRDWTISNLALHTWFLIVQKLLIDQLREIELQVDDLKNIKESDSLLDRNFKEVVTPKIHTESSCITTIKG